LYKGSFAHLLRCVFPSLPFLSSTLTRRFSSIGSHRTLYVSICLTERTRAHPLLAGRHPCHKRVHLAEMDCLEGAEGESRSGLEGMFGEGLTNGLVYDTQRAWLHLGGVSRLRLFSFLVFSTTTSSALPRKRMPLCTSVLHILVTPSSQRTGERERETAGKVLVINPPRCPRSLCNLLRREESRSSRTSLHSPLPSF
jgi:hypothetical protein